eukprot:GHVU01114967.1.p1 GENE.GHVU01114967.1~~GHVU01114967.1.p1  ORF type:complete len:488 (-),score=54.12 GHVU01114967.1:313-1776(-)
MEPQVSSEHAGEVDPKHAQSLIEGHETQIVTLDTSLEHLKALTEETLARRDHHLSKIKFYQSLLAPIRHLPVEVMSMVFVEYMEYSPLSSRHVLSLVCRRWKSILDSTPFAWSRINLNPGIGKPQPPLDAVAAHIKRAGQSALAIDIHADGKQDEMQTMYELVNNNPWRRLDIDLGWHQSPLPLAVKSFINQLSTSAKIDHLIHFGLRSKFGLEDVPEDELQTVRDVIEKATSLISLHIPYTFLPPSHAIFKRVTDLSLTGPAGDKALPNVLSVLRECTELRSLSLNGGFPIHNTGTKVHPFTLPNLRQIHLDECYSLYFMLSTLRIPNLETLKVERCDGEGLMDGFRNILEHSKGGSKITKLVIGCGCAEQPFVWLLQRLPGLRTLELQESSRMGIKLVELLKQRAGPRLPWACPKLVNINVSDCKKLSLEMLQDVLRMRKKASEEPAPKGTKNKTFVAPVALETLIWNGIDVMALKDRSYTTEAP